MCKGLVLHDIFCWQAMMISSNSATNSHWASSVSCFIHHIHVQLKDFLTSSRLSVVFYRICDFFLSRKAVRCDDFLPFLSRRLNICIIPLCWVTFCIHSGIIPWAIFPEMCKINQSSVNFYCKPLWSLWLDWFSGLVPPDLFYGGGAKVTQHNGDNTVLWAGKIFSLHYETNRWRCTAFTFFVVARSDE